MDKFVFIFISAVSVIGIVQWVKALQEAIERKDGSWKKVVFTLIVSFIVSASSDGGIFIILTNGWIILATVQLCWDMILRGFFKIIESVINKFTNDSIKIEETMKKVDGFISVSNDKGK
jgi:hypothetical protein